MAQERRAVDVAPLQVVDPRPRASTPTDARAVPRRSPSPGVATPADRAARAAAAVSSAIASVAMVSRRKNAREPVDGSGQTLASLRHRQAAKMPDQPIDEAVERLVRHRLPLRSTGPNRISDWRRLPRFARNSWTRRALADARRPGDRHRGQRSLRRPLEARVERGEFDFPANERSGNLHRGRLRTQQRKTLLFRRPRRRVTCRSATHRLFNSSGMSCSRSMGAGGYTVVCRQHLQQLARERKTTGERFVQDDTKLYQIGPLAGRQLPPACSGTG